MAKKFLDYSGLDRFLEKIKSWASDKFATKDVATTAQDGLMSSSDKEKLNASIKELSVNGRVITYTKTDGSTDTITTQDTNTTYVAMDWGEASSGVGTTGRLITAKILHDKIQNELPSVMTGATASSSGKSGLVPTPGSSQRTKYLRGDGSWETPTDTTYVNATTSTAGLMSASDKSKFNTMSTWYDGVVGTDSDKVVNKWDEIVTFLDGIPEGDTLDGLIEAVKTQVGDLKDDIEDGTVIAQESKTLGHETIGSTTKPIYLTSGVATPCTYTLGTSVPSDAKFTDNNTTYSFAGGTNKFTVTPSGGTAQEVSVTPSIANNVTYSGTLTSGQVAVLDGTNGKIKASGYTIEKSVPTDAVFTDTHYTAKNVVSNSANATANNAATNGDVHINLVENNTCRSGIKIVGSGATAVSCDDSGNITILSSDTNTTYVAMKGATASSAGTSGLVPAPTVGQYGYFLRGDGVWTNRVHEFGDTGTINIGTSYSNATGWFRIAVTRDSRSLPSVFRVMLRRLYGYLMPEAYVFDICTSFLLDDTVSITQVAGYSTAGQGDKAIDKIRVVKDGSDTFSLMYLDFHVSKSSQSNTYYWSVIGNATALTGGDVVYNPTITSSHKTTEFAVVNGFKTNGDIYEGDSTLSNKYVLTTKGISTSASNKGVKVTLGGTVGSPTIGVTTTFGNANISNSSYAVSGETIAKSVPLLVAADGVIIPEKSDLNSSDFLNVGTYSCVTTTTAETLLNSPTREAFRMDVETHSVNTSMDGSWGYRIRRITTIYLSEYVQYVSTDQNANKTFSPWRKVLRDNTTFTGATSSSVGTGGAVPAPQTTSDNTKFLRGDGTWATPTDTTYSVATSSVNGLMSATDKGNLDNILNGTKNVEKARKISVVSCTSTSNSKAWNVFNPTEWQTVKFYDVYADGGPVEYGNIMEIAGLYGHLKPQLWFDGGSGQMRVRNRGYSGSAYNDWRTVLDSVNYTEHLSSYATKSDITDGNITAAKATTADSANAIGGKGLNDLVQGGGTIKFIKVVTSLPASPSNDTLYLIKQ